MRLPFLLTPRVIGRMAAVLAAVSLAAPVLPAHAAPTVVLVRHAEIQGESMADPKPLPLSETGMARAERLRDALRDAGVGAIYVTEFTRTQATARPIAQAMHVEPIVIPKTDTPALVERLRRDEGAQTVLVVGHKDTLPTLMKLLGVTVDVQVDAKDHGGLYVVTPRKGEPPALLRLRY